MKRISFSKAKPVSAGKGWSACGRSRSVKLASFDPALPEDGSLIIAGVLRDQFNGLKDMFDGIVPVNEAVVDGVSTLPPADPAWASAEVVGKVLHFYFGIPHGPDGAPGQPGETGPPGPPFAQAVVDGVTTLAPEEPAWVEVSFDGTDVHFNFGIPQGFMGLQGEPGQQGEQGGEGRPGPPFAQAVVDGVTTLAPEESAWVEVSFDGTDVHFSFGIPQGYNGSPGEQGAPGEVTTAQMEEAIASVVNTAVAGTSANSNGVAPLEMVVGDPPSQAEVQTIANKLDELILALRR